MKKMVLLMALPLILTSCNKNNDETFKYNKDYLYGIDEIIVGSDKELNYSNTGVIDFDLDITVDLLKMLGTKSFRFRIPKALMTNHNGVIDEDCYSYMLIAQQKLIDAGITNLIGSSQWILPDYSINGGIPNFDAPNYVNWLNDVSSWWERLSSAFPNITKWEVGNEPNFGFLPILDNKYSSLISEARVITDYMYYAKEGILKGNPSAKLVMPGISGTSANECANFLDKIYTLIESNDMPTGKVKDNNPDNYFDILCWHCYISNIDESNEHEFFNYNETVHEVVKKHNDDGKPVYMTEVGYCDNFNKQEIKKNATSYQYIFNDAKNLPYLEVICVFRLYNEVNSSWGSFYEKSFGLFYEPDEFSGFNPKDTAWTIQKIYGGMGALDKYK